MLFPCGPAHRGREIDGLPGTSATLLLVAVAGFGVWVKVLMTLSLFTGTLNQNSTTTAISVVETA